MHFLTVALSVLLLVTSCSCKAVVNPQNSPRPRPISHNQESGNNLFGNSHPSSSSSSRRQGNQNGINNGFTTFIVDDDDFNRGPGVRVGGPVIGVRPPRPFSRPSSVSSGGLDQPVGTSVVVQDPRFNFGGSSHPGFDGGQSIFVNPNSVVTQPGFGPQSGFVTTQPGTFNQPSFSTQPGIGTQLSFGTPSRFGTQPDLFVTQPGSGFAFQPSFSGRPTLFTPSTVSPQPAFTTTNPVLGFNGFGNQGNPFFFPSVQPQFSPTNLTFVSPVGGGGTFNTGLPFHGTFLPSSNTGFINPFLTNFGSQGVPFNTFPQQFVPVTGFPQGGFQGQPGVSFPGSTFGQPTFGQPTFVQPTFGQPTFGQPTVGQPTFGQPPFNTPFQGSDQSNRVTPASTSAIKQPGSLVRFGVRRRGSPGNRNPTQGTVFGKDVSASSTSTSREVPPSKSSTKA